VPSPRMGAVQELPNRSRTGLVMVVRFCQEPRLPDKSIVMR